MDAVKIADGIEALKEGALWLNDDALLAVADLHLGYEGVLQREGVAIPRRQKTAMLQTLGRLIESRSPDVVLVNGDFKHNFSRNLDEERLEVKEVLTFLCDRSKLVIVRGNHDNYLPAILRDMGIELRQSYRAGGYVFAHGHLEIKTKLPIIIGHEHPALKLRDSVGAMLSIPAFVVGSDFVVMPALSPLALGSDVTSLPYLSPVLRSRNMGEADILGLDEKEGILDFGKLSYLRGHGVSLALR